MLLADELVNCRQAMNRERIYREYAEQERSGTVQRILFRAANAMMALMAARFGVMWVSLPLSTPSKAYYDAHETIMHRIHSQDVLLRIIEVELDVGAGMPGDVLRHAEHDLAQVAARVAPWMPGPQPADDRNPSESIQECEVCGAVDHHCIEGLCAVCRKLVLDYRPTAPRAPDETIGA